MSTERVGRNDPCPCGSGKKYKHCCMRKDRRQGTRTQPLREARPQGTLASAVAQVRGMARRVDRRGRAKETAALDQLLEEAEDLVAFEAMSDEIYDAMETLKEYRPEFEATMGNHEEASGRAWRLFSEDRFARWRFTAEDMYSAFEAVGYPQSPVEAPENDELIQAALLHLVGREQRNRLAWQLLVLLPEYVDAGRYLDAWLIQYSAFLMLDQPELNNPFLFVMFHLGYTEWLTRIEDQRSAAMRELGFDPDEIRASRPSFEELEARVEAALADPEKRARMEVVYERSEMLAAQAEAEVWGWERNAVDLLQREDAARLYLSDEEMEAWIPLLEERLGPLSMEVQRALAEGREEDPDITGAVGKEMWAISKEMAAEIFVPRRVERLQEELKAYRHDLEAAKERQFASSVHGAIISLRGENLDPGEEPLLIAICFASIRALLIRFADEAGAVSG